MLVPKRVKFRKTFRGKNKGLATRGTNIDFGEYALMSLEHGLISSRQLEAARRVIAHFTRRGGKVWIRIFPDKPLTKKPPEVTMGSGKGDVFDYAAVVKPGRILFEISGVTKEIASEAFRLCSDKLPIKTRFVEKE